MSKACETLGVVAILAGLAAAIPGADVRSGDEVPDAANTHADRRAGIDGSNVGGLRLAWKIEMTTPVTHRPLVEDGRVYFADWGGTVTAADAKTGKVLWQKSVEKPKTEWAWHGFCGTGALGEGLVFEASTEGNAFALDARTGEVKWTTRFAGDNKFAGNCGATLYHGGQFFVGVSSVEEGQTEKDKDFKPTFRGRVVALDAKTGKPAWERFLCEPPATGVAVWGSFAFDIDTNTLFFATGNNYTGKGTKLSDSVVAVDARTGKVRWSRQVTADDVWTVARPEGPDYDFGTGPQLFEGTANGKSRKLVGAGQKNGVYHALDRETGAVVWQAVVGYGQTAGGIMGDASVGDGRVFVWSNNSFNHGLPIDKHRITVKALNAATGVSEWVVPQAQPAGISTAGFLSKDVYFVPSLDGRMRAYHAKDGRLLWTSPEDRRAVGASLSVAGDTLYVGRGLPKAFDGDDKAGGGVYAYRPGGGR